ncbi:MAG: DNA polymerase III subunit delta [Bryobacteraceae bacterium]
MSPDQFIDQVKKGKTAPAYLFLGPEPWQRDECRQALIDAVLGTDLAAEDREAGSIRHDMEEMSLTAVIDDAQSLSLFAPRRVIWISRAESALPRGRAVKGDDDDKGAGDGAPLKAFLADPAPGVAIVFDSARFELDGEDKAKSERVRKFYGAIPHVVEFPRWSVPQARALAQALAREHKLRISAEEITLLVEAVGGSPARVAVEIEKLRLFAGEGGVVNGDAIAALVPKAQATTIFKLVDALAKNDRRSALTLLDVLVREGEYLPLALQFLAAQFRQALVAQEAGMRSGHQIQGFFTKQGLPMWPSRAAQVAETAASFSQGQLRRALRRISDCDRALKDIRPDDRLVMEEFLVGLMK